MMGMAKQLGGELLGSALGGGKKNKHSGHGGHGGHGSHGSHGGQMTDAQLMKEALKAAKHKDIKKIDPKVLDYAATRLQAGFRGYQTRKKMKNGNYLVANYNNYNPQKHLY